MPLKALVYTLPIRTACIKFRDDVYRLIDASVPNKAQNSAMRKMVGDYYKETEDIITSEFFSSDAIAAGYPKSVE